MEERIAKLEEQTKWLMKIHTTGILIFAIGISAYLIYRKK
jgi:hypothetical protein